MKYQEVSANLQNKLLHLETINKFLPVFHGMASYFPRFASSTCQNVVENLGNKRPYHGKLEEICFFATEKRNLKHLALCLQFIISFIVASIIKILLNGRFHQD